MNKVLETHQAVVSYLHSLFHDEATNAISNGWTLFRDPDKPEELGEVTAGASIEMKRAEVRRLITENGMDADTEAQSICGELLIKLDELLNDT